MIASLLGSLDEEERKEYAIALVVVLLFGAMTLHFVFEDASPFEQAGVNKVELASSTLSTAPSRAAFAADFDRKAALLVESKASSQVASASVTAIEVPVAHITGPEPVVSAPHFQKPAVLEAPVTPEPTVVEAPDTPEPVTVEAPEIPETSIVVMPESTDTTADLMPEPIVNAGSTPDPEETAAEATVVQAQTDGSTASLAGSADAEVYFDEASIELSDDARDKLTSVAQVLDNYTELKLRISGHADPVGNAQENLLLSQQRAQASRDFLVTQGIDPARLVLESYGESQASTENVTEAQRQRNRRVELRLEY